MSQNPQDRPNALRTALDAIRAVRTPDEAGAVASAALSDLITDRITIPYANAVNGLLQRVNDAAFYATLTRQAQRTAPEGFLGAFFSEIASVTRANGNGADAPREPAHASSRISHEARLEAERTALDAERRRITANQARVERELARVRSEEYANYPSGDPTMGIGAR